MSGGGGSSDDARSSKKMKVMPSQFFQALLLCLLLASTVSSSESDPLCGDCYRIDTVTLVGVVLGDVLLTVIIILVVYFCTKQSYQIRANIAVSAAVGYS
ncbi:hypothetical protein FKM82_019569 [Ascaphus truei]